MANATGVNRGTRLSPEGRRFARDLERRNLSPETRRRYLIGLERVEREAGPLLELDSDALVAWFDTLTCGPRTRYWYRTLLRSFYAWAVEDELLTADPSKRLPVPRYGRLVPRPVDDMDLVMALDGARPRMKAWLCLAAFNGFRAKEIAGLRREDVLDMAEPPMIVVSAPKGGRERVLALNPLTLRALRLYGLPRSGFVFTSSASPGRPVQPGTVTKLASTYLREYVGEGITLHRFRHSFATNLFRATRNLRLVQESLGHAHPQTTAVYAAYSSSDATEAITALAPPSGRWAVSPKGETPVVTVLPEPASERTPTLRDVLDRYIESQQGTHPTTLAKRVQVLEQAEAGVFPSTLLGATTRDLARWLARPRISKNTRYSYVAHLGAFYRWALVGGLIDVNPVAGVHALTDEALR